MVTDAEQYAEEDKQKREKIDLKNQADSLCYQSEKQLNDLGETIDATKKEPVTNLISDIRSNINSDNLDALESQVAELQKLMTELGNDLYNKGNQETNSDELNTPDTDSVIDTDFQE